MKIRDARRDDVPATQRIEVAAGRMFADLGMDLVAADDPLPTQTIEQYVDGGRCWVAVDSGDRPIGYILVEMVDAAAHIEQISVDPDFAGRRVGAALIERAVQWGMSRRASAVTLTTYVDVGWNGPYYVRLGFDYLAECDETPGLISKRAHEKSLGLDRWPRACMVRTIGAASTVEE
ncbi:GNAT family N-acetyltransferase [Gordonia sp. HY002]|uniref:GNAT family N-acetyltransferase n=1 Tax=Gordonia zhenghanii TaxID=2911516 RepID=UPI001EF057E1|nr:GNAT family N-acetyltransferase [Gordonia zhenghanii]MCF8569607.1 GNAT family N-acetyltransferase [Gordonia zhenghanii]MCF8602872.1 GNAT family N-acetyltransferase [Gordonia zhenghanii]